jgi:hypothetical protein
MEYLILVDVDDPEFWHQSTDAGLQTFAHEGPVYLHAGRGEFVRRWACFGNNILAIKNDFTDQ